MAQTYKGFTNNDIVSTRTMLHEAIPVTGSIVSGTYGVQNIKNYSHGMFQSVYDYPYLSSSANHIFDITCGFSSTSALSKSGPTAGSTKGYSSLDDQKKKINIYNEMAQLLVGYDSTGAIRKFDQDGDLTGGTKMNECYFFNFSRLLQKDEIKKGSFSMSFITGGINNALSGTRLQINDVSASNDYRVNSPAGEYGILSASGPTGQKTFGIQVGDPVGLIYYQAGIVVLTSSIFSSGSCPNGGVCNDEAEVYQSFGERGSKAQTTEAVLSGSTIEQNCNAVRNRLYNISFNNTTELNSTIYFCRANHNDFNYSTNQTYLNASKIVVKNTGLDEPVSYATTIGLYSDDKELLAVAKLSEPIKKTPSNELTFRVRLDY